MHPGSWTSYLPALFLAVAGVGTLGAISLAPDEAAGAPVAVFAWDDAAVGIVAAAGGRIVSPGGWPGSIIAVSDDPLLADRLYAAGAALVLRADETIGCVNNKRPGETS